MFLPGLWLPKWYVCRRSWEIAVLLAEWDDVAVLEVRRVVALSHPLVEGVSQLSHDVDPEVGMFENFRRHLIHACGFVSSMLQSMPDLVVVDRNEGRGQSNRGGKFV